MRRAALPLAAIVVVLLALVGHYERRSRATTQSDGMRSVLEEVGQLDSPSLRGFRIFTRFHCLVYERGRNDFALELCVDLDGRVVEAIDRRGGTPRIWSLRDDPHSSTLRADRHEVNRLLRRMNVPERYLTSVEGET